jgi:hypothetical protein
MTALRSHKYAAGGSFSKILHHLFDCSKVSGEALVRPRPIRPLYFIVVDLQVGLQARLLYILLLLPEHLFLCNLLTCQGTINLLHSNWLDRCPCKCLSTDLGAAEEIGQVVMTMLYSARHKRAIASILKYWFLILETYANQETCVSRATNQPNCLYG